MSLLKSFSNTKAILFVLISALLLFAFAFFKNIPSVSYFSFFGDSDIVIKGKLGTNRVSINNQEQLSLLNTELGIFKPSGVFKSMNETIPSTISKINIQFTTSPQEFGIYLDKNRETIRSFNFTTKDTTGFLTIHINNEITDENTINYSLVEYLYKVSYVTQQRDFSEISKFVKSKLDEINKSSVPLLKLDSNITPRFFEKLVEKAIPSAYAQSCGGSWACGQSFTSCTCSSTQLTCTGDGEQCGTVLSRGTCNCENQCVQTTLNNCNGSTEASCKSGFCGDCFAAHPATSCGWTGSSCNASAWSGWTACSATSCGGSGTQSSTNGCGTTVTQSCTLTCKYGCFAGNPNYCALASWGTHSSISSCNASCTPSGASCGNGSLEAGEECDDGNNAPGDLCSPSCRIETAVCGNFIQEGSEACDDGNTLSGDGCEADCTRPNDPPAQTCSWCTNQAQCLASGGTWQGASSYCSVAGDGCCDTSGGGSSTFRSGCYDASQECGSTSVGLPGWATVPGSNDANCSQAARIGENWFTDFYRNSHEMTLYLGGRSATTDASGWPLPNDSCYHEWGWGPDGLGGKKELGMSLFKFDTSINQYRYITKIENNVNHFRFTDNYIRKGDNRYLMVPYCLVYSHNTPGNPVPDSDLNKDHILNCSRTTQFTYRKECYISTTAPASPDTVTEGSALTVFANGTSSDTAGDTLRVFIERVGGGQITDAYGNHIIPNGTSHSTFGGINYYQYSVTRITANNQQAQVQATFTNLPPGDYHVHCDLPNGGGDPVGLFCSGNPFCGVNGGSIIPNCAWDSCSGPANQAGSDNASFSVSPGPKAVTVTVLDAVAPNNPIAVERIAFINATTPTNFSGSSPQYNVSFASFNVPDTTTNIGAAVVLKPNQTITSIVATPSMGTTFDGTAASLQYRGYTWDNTTWTASTRTITIYVQTTPEFTATGQVYVGEGEVRSQLCFPLPGDQAWIDPTNATAMTVNSSSITPQPSPAQVSNTDGSFTIEGIQDNGGNFTTSLTSLPAGYQVACPAGGSYSIPSNQPNIDINYFISEIRNPWYQIAGGNILSDTTLSFNIPGEDTCVVAAGCDPYFIAKELYSPYAGVSRQAQSAGIPITRTAISTTTPGYTTDRANPSTAAVTSAANAESLYDYEYFKELISADTTAYDLTQSEGTPVTIVNSNTFSGPAPSSDSTEVYRVQYGAVLRPTAPINIDSDRKIVLFVQGDLIVDGSSLPLSSSLTVVDEGSNLIFIVSGDIVIESTVGATNFASTLPQLEGIFIATGKIIVESTGATGERKFIGAGTFIGQESVELQRDFNNNNNPTANKTSPTELFIHRPDLVLNWPNLLKESTLTWKEAQ